MQQRQWGPVTYIPITIGDMEIQIRNMRNNFAAAGPQPSHTSPGEFYRFFDGLKADICSSRNVPNIGMLDADVQLTEVETETYLQIRAQAYDRDAAPLPAPVLKPLHMVLLDRIPRAGRQSLLNIGFDLTNGVVPDSHDDLSKAYLKRAREVGLMSDGGVCASLLAQKKAIEAAAKAAAEPE